MRFVRCLTIAALFAVVAGGPACVDRSADEPKGDAGTALGSTKAAADTVLEAAKKAGDQTADVTKDVAHKTADKAKDLAGDVAEKTKAVASATSAAMTDGWITTKVKAKLMDDTVLKDSDIHVNTDDHVVTLSGTVPSRAAHARAELLTASTEQVTSVRNRLVVK